MIKNTFLKLFFVLMLGGIVFTSCKEDEIDPMVTVTINAKPVIADAVSSEYLKGLEVQLKDSRTSNITKCVLDENGKGSIKVEKGTYDIAIDRLYKGKTAEENVVYSAKFENCNITEEGQIIEVKLNVFLANTNNSGFIFSEVFFNGERNSGWMMHPDQYYVVFNPTQEILYADGLSLATTAQASIVEKYEFFDQYMSDGIVPLTGFVTIPGSGKDYPVNPGEKFVIATTAIDHSAIVLGDTLAYDHAVDLSGADFEIYPDFWKGDKDIDNPDVPNMIITADLYSHPRGFWSHLIFKLENGLESTVKSFYEANNTVFKQSNGKERLLIFLKKEQILDGLVTGDQRPMKTRPLPEEVDRGYFQVSGCHRQELAIRKEIKVGNKVFYKDSNNSDEDFEKRVGQTPYPKDWRNK